jgi:PIN domain nuclease of toxin-antitoxin system
VKLLLDTQFLLWLTTRTRQARKYKWVDRYMPWGVSPISLLEIDFLFEIGDTGFSGSRFAELLSEDERFVIDDISLTSVIAHAHDLGWTRDPFDRLLVAHSSARRVPFCTTDGTILEHHSLIPRELRKE